MKFVLVFCFLFASPLYVQGHGMVMDPVNRGSRWRVDPSAPANYEDNQQWCGGGWIGPDRLCGMCGDGITTPQPRAHELGGRYGQGVIVKSYQSGTVMPVQVRITANHRGFFRFQLCNMDKFGRESDECYNDLPLKFANGQDSHTIETHLGNHDVELQIPAGLTCNHCILQWTYVAANIWGTCPDGTTQLGCGPQENYRTCSDITITA